MSDNYSDLFLGLDVEVPLLNGGKTRYINFDNAASTPPMKPVQDAINEFVRYYSSVHRGTGYKSQLSTHVFEEARQILRDIDSLDSHTEFLFEKINFLMDATVGFININQNKIIKIFSVASVALLPPTLIASIYGMNFQAMPELTQDWGYPYALCLMVASAVVPMWYFRRRGWLK